jgi:hypothetical protein
MPNKLTSMIMSLGIETCKRRSLAKIGGKTLNHMGKDMSTFAHLDTELNQALRGLP